MPRHLSLATISCVPAIPQVPDVASTFNTRLLNPSARLAQEMDIPRGPSVALALPYPESHFPRRLVVSRPGSQTSSDSVRPREAMAIPGARLNDAPPPLPPQPYNEDLANGIDLAWRWQNSDHLRGTRMLAPIKPGSSLLGGRTHAPVVEDDAQDMEIDDYPERRTSTASTVRSPSYSEKDLNSHIPNLIRRPPSPSSMTQR